MAFYNSDYPRYGPHLGVPPAKSLSAIICEQGKWCQNTNKAEHDSTVEKQEGYPRMCDFGCQKAEDKCLLLVHSKNHVNLIKNIGPKQFDSRRHKIVSKIQFYIFQSEAAYLAAGFAVEVYNFVRLANLYYAGSHGIDIKGPTRSSKYNKDRKVEAVLYHHTSDFLPMIDEVYRLLVDKTSNS